MRTAFIVYVVLPIGLAGGLVVWWGLQGFERQIETRMQNDLELVARAIERPLSHALLREREGSIASALKSAFALSHVYGAYLYDAEGRKVSDPSETDKPMARREVRDHVAEGERHGQYGEVGGRRVYSYFLPLTDAGGRITGLLQLTRRASDFEASIATLRRRAAGGFLVVFMALTMAVLYGHHRIFGKPLDGLAQSMAAISAGDHQRRVRPEGPNELMVLGVQFNHMMDNIEHAKREIAHRRDHQRILEARLRQSEKMAAVGEMAAGLAHELGTPISCIDAKAQRALRRGTLREPAAKVMQDIRTDVARIERIIRQMLDFSRRHTVQERLVTVHDLACAAQHAVTQEAAAHHVRVQIQGDESARIRCDPARIEQALVNLLTNAIQASPPEGEVCLSWRRIDDEVRMAVADEGPGIDPELETKIFEPFYTTKPVGKGTGLGLSVVHGIAEDHGGAVSVVRSRAGACLEIRIPLRQRTHPKHVAPPSPKSTRKGIAE